MTNKVYVKQYSCPKIDKIEMLRYAGVKSQNDDCGELLDELCSTIIPRLSYKVCYTVLPVCRGDHICIGGVDFSSNMLSEHFREATYALLFCATVGGEIDRQIARYSLRSPLHALLCNAIGTERVEALCDVFCRDIAAALSSPFERLPRYSPGYGDLSLECQRAVFDILSPERYIGVTLRESMIMSPSKSVTAFIPLHSPLTAPL